MQSKTPSVYDVVVIGGGPAGMFAAGRAAELGAKVLLLEKNPILGKKLLITGGGRCNVTNSEPDKRKYLAMYKDAAQPLFSPFSQFSAKDFIAFLEEHGVNTKEEQEGRVFPASDSSATIQQCLINYMKAGGVTVQTTASVSGFLHEKNNIVGVAVKGMNEIRTKACILATGGLARPETGSTGDGFLWLANLGHTVAQPTASLVPINLSVKWLKHVVGISLPNVRISVVQNGKKQLSKKGKLLFTHTGVSGPTILNISSAVGELLPYGEVMLNVDLLPERDHGELGKEILERMTAESNKKLKNLLAHYVPSALAGVVAFVAGVNPEAAVRIITREERIKILKTLKNFPMRVGSLAHHTKAIVANGGVALSEIDTKTMQSRKYPNLYLTGDILNIDRPSGGYSLQLCWTTGFVAGTHAAKTT